MSLICKYIYMKKEKLGEKTNRLFRLQVLIIPEKKIIFIYREWFGFDPVDVERGPSDLDIRFVDPLQLDI